MNHRPCYVEINLNFLRNNFSNIKNHVQKDIIAVVKANAYGHGAVEVSKVLLASGAKMLAVATVEEALTLRHEFINIPILILGPVADFQKHICIEHNISIIVSSKQEAIELSTLAKSLSKHAIAHVALDTGMTRVGVFAHSLDSSVLEEIYDIVLTENIDFEGIFTHFASADSDNLDFVNIQYSRFETVINFLNSRGISFKYIHCQNSAASINSKFDVCNCVRAGIALYGYYPSSYVERKLELQPILSWKCKISHIKHVPIGTPVGYGSTFISEHDMKIATIPVGYADGFRRSLSNGFRVGYKDNLVPVVGRVCMDQSMIDVTSLPCSVGDTIDLINGVDVTAETMANADNTISYDILCGISSRVPRVYIE